ncbi:MULTISPECIES: hypothetical protein [unclassified Streptococcus]|nr:MULTISPECIES: hypothetical protein [unclassified Streptococcus]MBF8969809.1 hypothetical protein [Streptococcus sp. NLN76]MBG9366698.1 hypothetical protein [Streptococcus sp. NLN64]
MSNLVSNPKIQNLKKSELKLINGGDWPSSFYNLFKSQGKRYTLGKQK